jgi:hypothetical protein
VSHDNERLRISKSAGGETKKARVIFDRGNYSPLDRILTCVGLQDHAGQWSRRTNVAKPCPRSATELPAKLPKEPLRCQKQSSQETGKYSLVRVDRLEEDVTDSTLERGTQG